ncbi:MAG: CocE/NonD family hydrolase [SAR324 cluster bacterium]|nr:CocE/NonD family hydrolase [SAR324 cluster bacterium]
MSGAKRISNTAPAILSAVLVAALLVVAVCLWPVAARSQSESQPRYGVITETDVMVPMADGTLLAIDIYRPAAEGKFPALVERTPYDKTSSSEIRVGAHTYFAERGYVFLVQDTRGRFASQGDFYPFLDDGWLEHRDGFDTVNWIARQPWSNGDVGVLGGSHTGQTAYMIAPTQPPALRAIFARESASDLYDHWIYRGGAFEHAFVTAWTARFFAPDIVTRTYEGAERDGVLAMLEASVSSQQTGYWNLPLTDYAAFKSIAGLQFYDDWLAHNTDGAYWWQQNVGLQHHRFQVPVYHLGGWYDIFLPGTLNNYTGIAANGGSALARNNQKLVIGPWVHGPTNVGQVAVGDLEFPGADAVSYNGIRLKWFDRWLLGAANGVMDEPPVLIYVMGDNEWRTENEWPLARTEYRAYYFGGGTSGSIDSLNDGTLSTQAPRGAHHPHGFEYDPRDPVPTLGGNTLFVANGPRDHRKADQRSLTYTSDVLSRALEVTGPIKAVLYGVSSAVDTDWTVRISEVYPDGRSINIVDGILRARYRESKTHPTLIEPGRIYRYEIDLWATSNVFQAGNRIRVAVHSSNFPRWDRNLNTAESPETGARPQTALNTVFLDELRPSHVILPIIPR